MLSNSEHERTHVKEELDNLQKEQVLLLKNILNWRNMDRSFYEKERQILVFF